jgi:hypothetical protein|tara:strand:- start:1288 stop:1545 length:258 start_codon:yes stop_codon:yes gene_type:complete
MASIQLTQVILLQTVPPTNPPTVYVVENSESLLAINPVLLTGVGSAYQPDGTIMDVRQIYIQGGNFTPLYVTDSYATIKAYIDAV